MDNLASVMFANLQRVVFCRKTIILIAIGQFTGKRREFILHAIAAIGLIPGKYFTYGLDRQLREQVFYPCSRADNRFFRLILTVNRFNSYAIIVMTNCGDRAVEQLRTARFLRQLDPGFNRQFAAQKPESVSNKPM